MDKKTTLREIVSKVKTRFYEDAILEKGMARNLERFPECSLFKYRQCEEKVNRVGNKRGSGLPYSTSKIKT